MKLESLSRIRQGQILYEVVCYPHSSEMKGKQNRYVGGANNEA